MIYIILNLIAVFIIAIFTRLVDNKIKVEKTGVSSVSIAMLLCTIESALFVIVLLMKRSGFEALVSGCMKIMFSIEGISFVILSFGFLEIGSVKKHTIVSFIKYALYLFAIYVSFFKFYEVDVSFDKGYIVASTPIITGPARQFFPWNWFSLFTFLYRYIIPICSLIFLMLIQEEKASQLEKYQTLVIGEGIVLMWIVNVLINYIKEYVSAFSLLFIYSYLFMYVIIYSGISKTTVPSGKAIFVTLFKSLISYIIPAFAIAAFCMIFQPVNDNFVSSFVTTFIICGVVVIILSLLVSGFLSTSSKLYTADYEEALEKDLAKVEYKNEEMDRITAKMFEIMKRNVESSSMTVYILSGANELDVAYSSNNMTNKIQLNNPMFDTLLNINKSIVVYSQLEKEHDISVVQTELEDFFKATKSDALFLLNEGHNIFGIITLGKKASGDHYKEYDYNVFVKLYSYFFVFGYYMRNISNKDVMSVVNREIKMSSQIITSIQENIDHPKSTKVDIGYLMVPAHNIGGEFIDMIRLTETRHLFVVGDLSGKGIAASMNMVILKSIIRTYLAEIHDFKQLVVKVNEFIRDSLRKGTIFAGLFALVDFETDTMYYINCGVPTLMMYTQVYNNVIEIQGSGHILGFVKDISPYISVKTTKLNRGDIIMACTDGMIQSHSLRGEQFGKERVQQAVLDNSTYPAQRMAQFTFDGLLKFMSKEMEDDVSMLVIKYEGVPEENETEVTAAEENNETTEATDVTENVENPEVTENAETSEAITESVPETPVVDSPMDAVADEFVEPQNMQEENVTEENAPVEETKNESSQPSGLTPPEGFDMSELNDLDDMLKEAGL